MSNQTAPKVFISHASEDKERFVMEFATQLRSRWIDAWVDAWEILGGDSLPRKIFDEGLGKSEVVIVVLSQISITKPWVRDELDSAIVQRIENQTRIIPVILDIEKEQIPPALRHLKWIPILDIDNYEKQVSEIVDIIFNRSSRPPLGEPPKYIAIDRIPSLTSIDTQVLRRGCEHAIEQNSRLVQDRGFFEAIYALGISQEQLLESAEILNNKGLIEPSRTIGSQLAGFTITVHGFENYGRFCIPNFHDLIRQTMALLVNDGLVTNGDIADRLGIALLTSEFILDLLHVRGYIKVLKTLGGNRDNVRVFTVTVQGKRFLQD